MGQGNRRERLAGALEEQFGECHSAFSLCMEKAHQAGIMPCLLYTSPSPRD